MQGYINVALIVAVVILLLKSNPTLDVARSIHEHAAGARGSASNLEAVPPTEAPSPAAPRAAASLDHSGGISAADFDRLKYDTRDHEFYIVTDMDHASRGLEDRIRFSGSGLPTDGSEDPKGFVEPRGERKMEKSYWGSVLRKGVLKRVDGLPGEPETDKPRYRIEWLGEQVLRARMNRGGRSMELSELLFHHDKLFGFCDVTGLVWKIRPEDGALFQRWALADGDGDQPRPFKSEWSTTRDGMIWVGSMGRAFQDAQGRTVHRDSEWTKTIDLGTGRVQNYRWSSIYAALRTAANVTEPGYLWHEAVAYVGSSREWIFAPRKRSPSTPYTPKQDYYRGANLLLRASDDFAHVHTVTAGPREDTFGFTAIRAVPGSHGVYLALKSKEVEDQVHSKITVLSAEGEVLLDERMPEVVATGGGIEVATGGRSVPTVAELLPLRTFANQRRRKVLEAVEAWLGQGAIDSTEAFCLAALRFAGGAASSSSSSDGNEASRRESGGDGDRDRGTSYAGKGAAYGGGGEGRGEHRVGSRNATSVPADASASASVADAPVGKERSPRFAEVPWPAACHRAEALENERGVLFTDGRGPLLHGVPVSGVAAVVEGVGLREGFADLGPFKFEGLAFVPTK